MKHSATKRTIWEALIYELDGDLNLSQLFAAIVLIVGCAGFVFVNIVDPTTNTIVKVASWSFLGAIFSLALLAALPVSKEKVLAKYASPANIAKGIAGTGGSESFSTDIQEIKQRAAEPDDRG